MSQQNPSSSGAAWLIDNARKEIHDAPLELLITTENSEGPIAYFLQAKLLENRIAL